LTWFLFFKESVLTFKIKTSAVAVALALSPLAYAAEQNLVIDEVVVNASSLSNSAVDKNTVARKRASTSDTAKMLEDQPGVSLYGAGGVSSLPAIHGMADDRVRVKVDGMDLISACANHMNSPLSYIDPSKVDSVKVFAGITPVSVGGDSIGGTIQVDSAALVFAEKDKGTLIKGVVGAFYRSNSEATGGHASATLASETISVRYTGSTVKAKNFKAGGDFKAAGVSTGSLNSVYLTGDEVGSSAYQVNNQSLALGVRQGNHLAELNFGLQSIPYQGFPNQYMDMLKNDSQQINLKYAGQYDWGKLNARAYNEQTKHYMNYLEAKQTSSAGMPMDTDGKNTGVVLKGDVVLAGQDILRVGTELQQYRLDDWWNPTSASANGMMSPNTFWNIKNGQRDRLAVFSEWDAIWSPQWASQLGLRSETVSMNTGNVQGYNNANMTSGMMGMTTNYLSEANAFNALEHKRIDNNIDVTALSRFTPDAGKTFEIGFAQKTRSPNLYERYTWSSTSMSMKMVNMNGDGNGYIGNLNLKPEVARTLSTSASWHDAEADGFEVKLSPYYTLVENYIDAQRCTSGVACTAANLTATKGFVFLQFVNQSAQLYGGDASARIPLGESGYGKLTAHGVLNYVQGKNLTTNDNLYHIMPLNATLALEQHSGDWTNSVEVKLVDDKNTVSAVRNEVKTKGYGLLNLHSSYDTKTLRFDVSVENLLNKLYADPMGGSYLGQKTQAYGTSVPGMGRSLNASATYKF
jgi:iron complex outermembrane receptor protein